MSYHCGVGHGMQALGYSPREPHIQCDGCLKVYVIKARGAGGAAPAWFIDGKAPPGWRKVNEGTTVEPVRRDYCKDCKR